MTNLTILIVDDEALTRKALKSGVHWEELGIERVLEAGSANAAKEFLMQEKVDLALIDIDMPGENGIELLGWIRENIGDKLPCSFLTCHADFSFAQQAIRHGSTDYLLKPVNYKEVEELILKMAHQTRQRREEMEISRYGRQWLQEREIEGRKHEKMASTTEEIVDGLVIYIRSHLSEKLSLAELAHDAGLNMNYLNKVFKDKTGDTVNQFIIKEKMVLAARLLREGKVRAYAIAESLGYENYANFVNMFKKVYGKSPNQYAEEHREKVEKQQPAGGE